MRNVTLRVLVLLGVWSGLIDRSYASESCNGVPDPKALAIEQHLARVAHQLLPSHVQKAVETLGNASSVHLRARISLSSKGTGGRPLAGVYEYWEKDGKYRIHFGIDVAENPVSEIAYDGRQYQLALDRASSILSIRRADERSVPSEIPNPLFLVLQPFRIETPDCPGCEPRLSDLRTLRELLHASPAEKSLAPLDTAGYGTKVALTPSGHLATSVLSNSETGLVERSEFSDYGAIDGTDLELPRTVRFSRTTNRSAVGVVIRYQVEELELDRPIDDAVFTLDRSPYASIWSDDSQTFLRAPHCSKSPAAQ